MDTSKNPNFIPTAALLKNFLACIYYDMRRGENLFTPCIWANFVFLEASI